MDSFPDTLLKSRYAAEKKSILALCEKGDTFSLADLARELGTTGASRNPLPGAVRACTASTRTPDTLSAWK